MRVNGGGAFCQKEAQQLGTQVGNLLANQDRSDLEYRDKPNKHAKKQPSHRNKPSETHINTDVNRSIKLAFWGLRWLPAPKKQSLYLQKKCEILDYPISHIESYCQFEVLGDISLFSSSLDDTLWQT